MAYQDKLASIWCILTESRVEELKQSLFNKVKALVGDELPADVELKPTFTSGGGPHHASRIYFARLRHKDHRRGDLDKEYYLYYQGSRIGITHDRTLHRNFGDLKAAILRQANQLGLAHQRRQQEYQQAAGPHLKLKQFLDNIWNQHQIGPYTLTARDEHTHRGLEHWYKIAGGEFTTDIELSTDAKVTVKAKAKDSKAEFETYSLMASFNVYHMPPRTFTTFLNDLRRPKPSERNRYQWNEYGVPDQESPLATIELRQWYKRCLWAMLRTVLAGIPTELPPRPRQSGFSDWVWQQAFEKALGDSESLATKASLNDLVFYAHTDFGRIVGKVTRSGNGYLVRCMLDEADVHGDTHETRAFLGLPSRQRILLGKQVLRFTMSKRQLNTPGWLLDRINQLMAQRLSG